MTMNIDRPAHIDRPLAVDDPARLNGATVVGGDGEKLGNVDAVYYDNATDRPEWVSVRGGLFGTRVALVPLRRADYAGDTLRVPFDKVQLRNAPHHDPGRELSPADEEDLYRYYGIDRRDRPIGRPDTGKCRGTGMDAVDSSAETAEFALDGRADGGHRDAQDTDAALRERQSI